ncbi:histone H2A.1-like [Chironomus tepperi]|uniref:histone H2A.1-like n=1 Tax=Chironomus tepperi TaxID=113505 RepID=UPI00391FC7EF
MAKTKTTSQASTTKSESNSTRATPLIEDHMEVFGSNPIRKSKKKPVTKTVKSGLTLPVARIQRHLKSGNYADRIGSGAAVYLTAVLEYLVAEVLELAGNAMKDGNKRRINPRHICLAIKNDVELNELIGNACISEGGVIPHINPVLLPVRTTKRKSDVNDEEAPKKKSKPESKKNLAAKKANKEDTNQESGVDADVSIKESDSD